MSHNRVSAKHNPFTALCSYRKYDQFQHHANTAQTQTIHTFSFLPTPSLVFMFIVSLFRKETLSGFKSVDTKDGSEMNLQEMHVEDQYTPPVKCALQLPPPFDPQTSTSQHKIKTLNFHVNNLDRILLKE